MRIFRFRDAADTHGACKAREALAEANQAMGKPQVRAAVSQTPVGKPSAEISPSQVSSLLESASSQDALAVLESLFEGASREVRKKRSSHRDA